MRLVLLFRSPARRELDTLIENMKINLANNYKEPAHDCRRRLGERCEALYHEGKLREKEYRAYRQVYEEYTEKLKDYHH